ncbi:MAG: L,D-transpeptidase family protein [Proteobacteria bacterium]|nr:L,D-transpeptidase family protein [Pseudomonadota bacterium]
MKSLCSAESYGLRSIEYLDCSGFDALYPRQPAIASTAEFDLGLTGAAIRFLNDIHFGRVDPRDAGFDFGIKRRPLPYAQILTALASAPDIAPVLSSVEPPYEHYRLLKETLARYRSAGTQQPVGANPLQEQQIRKIELTLERWRWLPEFSTPPIIVNIPQFRLFAFQTTRDLKAEIAQMDVIVGRAFPRFRTPVFAADLRYVVFRPYWDIPYSITKKEMLPELRRKRDFWQKQHLELVAGPGDSAPVVPFTAQNLDLLEAGKLRLRQQPGADNALGLIKFMLPNEYNVYLHSTPARQLFARSRRAFSHGCIRVSDPVLLATHVLRNAGDTWTAEAITAAMNGTETLRVKLKTPIRVMIVYATALAQEDGTTVFFDDIYGHDRRLEQLMGLPAVVPTQSAMNQRSHINHR